MCLCDLSDNDFRDIAFSGTTFVCGGLYDPDFREIVYFAGLDAKNWTLVNNFPVPKLMSVDSIIYTNNQFYAVGGVNATILISTDGRQWKVLPIPKLDNYESFYHVRNFKIGKDNIIAAAGSNGIVLLSNDGINFYKLESVPTKEIITDVAYGQGVMVAITPNFDDKGAMLYTKDSKFAHWQYAPKNTYFLLAVIYSEKYKLFIAGGIKDYNYGEAMIIASPDGEHWDIVYNFSRPGDNLAVNALTFNEELNLFIAVGSEMPIVYSNDARHWQPFDETKYPKPTEYFSLNSVAIYPPKIIVVGSDNTIWVSENKGQTWKDNSPTN